MAAEKDDNKWLPRRMFSFRDLRVQLASIAGFPFIGVTQGGSSRKWAGCKPAATDGKFRPAKEK